MAGVCLAARQRLPVKCHIDQMRQRDYKDDGAEIRGQDADLLAKRGLDQQSHQHRVRARNQHSEGELQRSKQHQHHSAEQQKCRKAEHTKIVQQVPANHFSYVGRPGNLDPEVFRIELRHNGFNPVNQFLWIPSGYKHHDVT